MTQFDQIAPDGGAGFGLRLREAREAAGLSQSEVATRLKMPVRVIQTLESDNWESLGAPVFVRGQLRSYARLLGVKLDPDLVVAPIPEVAPEVLVSHVHTPRYRRAADQMIKRAIYIVLTAAIVVPVWMSTRPHISNGSLSVEPLELPANNAAVAPPVRTGQQARVPTSPARTPLVASMATLPDVADSELTLRVSADSWIEIFDPSGRVVEQGLLRAGQRRAYASSDVGRLVLGNAAAVEVVLAGKPLNLEPFSRANVARFTLSSDGSIAPISP